jgi:hypothetical protein
MMVMTPLLAVIGSLCWAFSHAGVDLRPYLTLQGLLMVGCLATLAFAPSYPRLVFALSYNALFAALQVMVGTAVLLLAMRDERAHQTALSA